MRHSTILFGAATLAAVSVLAAPAGAQAGDRAERERARARVFVRGEDGERPVIGVSTSSSGERDTLGLLVVSVTPGGPADQAGIEEGNRIAAVNGTNLRLSAADAGERDMQGMTTRRLVRELGKVEPGAEVQLRVWQNGSYRDVRVKTVAAEDLPGRQRTTREEREARGVLGLRLGGGGSRRDTLGILVIGLAPDGPAEKAGLVEGDRIAAIGDVDVRVPAADAGDRWAASTRVNRFMRELRELKPGQSVTLRVRSGGATRTVNVTAVAARDLDEDGGVFIFGDHFGFDGSRRRRRRLRRSTGRRCGSARRARSGCRASTPAC
jgi:C-terminal processing protease CtpA/Prc